LVALDDNIQVNLEYRRMNGIKFEAVARQE
jgi:hypothetical protein